MATRNGWLSVEMPGGLRALYCGLTGGHEWQDGVTADDPPVKARRCEKCHEGQVLAEIPECSLNLVVADAADHQDQRDP